MKIRNYLIAALLAVIPAFGASAEGWKNPTSFNGQTGGGMADPFVFKYRGTYYVYVTGDNSKVLCWQSRDLVSWTGPTVCCTDPVAVYAYAPEVKYFNGKFYMVSSPSGNGHYVLTSDSPTGPFVCATKNLGNSIDGNVLIDDDGKWYFYHAGGGGIMGCPMSDPLTIGAERNLVPAMGGQWTEGPEVFKRNGKYYMFYCGNHYLSRAYRTNLAVSAAGPLSGFANQDSQNPILISADGVDNLYGLGHGSVVVGPDLDTYFFCYHNLVKGGSGTYRQFCMDRIGWNGDKLMMYGPTTWRQDEPVVAANDYFDRAALGDKWLTMGGSWAIADNDHLAQSNAAGLAGAAMLSSVEGDFTAEFTVRQTGEGGYFGAVYACADASNYSTAMINPTAKTIELGRMAGGAFVSVASYAINGVFDPKCWHSIRLERRGTELKVFVDGMLCGTAPDDGSKASGYVGYATNSTTADFSYIAVSPYVNGSAITSVHLPVPGLLSAVHAVETDAQTTDVSLAYGTAYALRLEAGNHATFNINTRVKSPYNIGLRYRSSAETKARILVDGTVVKDGIVLPSTGSEWKSVTVRDVSLPGLHSSMRIEVTDGNVELYELDVRTGLAGASVMSDDFSNGISKSWKHIEGNWTVENGWLKSPNYGKILMGANSALGLTDYTIECDMMFNSDVNAGVIFRVTNPALGGGGDDAQLGTDFAQGYFLGLTATSVVLGKQNYGWKQLVSKNMSFYSNQTYHVKVEVVGNTFTCYVGNMKKPVITYTDPLPFISGRAGFRTHSCVAKFDNFVLTPIADPATGIEGVAGDSALPSAVTGVFSISGQKVAAGADGLEALPKGIYVVKGNGGSRKVVKK